jgi:hypothetical protein
MKHRLGLRFQRWARWLFSGAFLLSLASGLCWFYLDRWGELEGEFGPEKHPWIKFLPKIHGAGAFACLMIIGAILGSHVPEGWLTRRRRPTGVLLLLDLAVIVLTAWGLYYAGSDGWRENLALAHLTSGLLPPFLLAAHVLKRRKRLS